MQPLPQAEAWQACCVVAATRTSAVQPFSTGPSSKTFENDSLTP
jgi:hypothetical protein